MKRSEMVDLIAEGLDQIETENHINFKTQAKAILALVEGFGMQPPNTTLDKLVPGDLKIAPGVETHYYACWEPESFAGEEHL